MNAKTNLDDLSEQGSHVLRNSDRVAAHLEFAVWVKSGSVWLKQRAPDSGLVAEWHSLGDSQSILNNDFQDAEVRHFLQVLVGRRLKWLSQLPARLKHLEGKQESPNPRANIHDDNMSKLIFISHTHDDHDLADAVLDLLSTALHLRRSDFVCTSVEGGELQGGAEPDTVLREQILQVPVFLSLLTPKALTSNYVLFELGARWGCDKPHIPLLAKGSGVEVIKAPLKKIGLHLKKENDVHRLVESLSQLLGRNAEQPSSYHSKLGRVVSIANMAATVKEEAIVQQPDFPTQSHQLSADAHRLLSEIANTRFGIARVSSMQGRDVIKIDGAANQDFLGRIDDPRDEARWRYALNELIQAGFLDQAPNKSFKVSHTGFKFAKPQK